MDIIIIAVIQRYIAFISVLVLVVRTTVGPSQTLADKTLADPVLFVSFVRPKPLFLPKLTLSNLSG